MRGWAALVGLFALGCVPPSVDLRGRACPCGDGWVCQDEVCVPAGEARTDGGDAAAGGDAGMDAGDMDAGDMDAGGMDAGGMDAGGMDAGMGADAGGMDAGGVDAGRMDAGVDAGAADSGAGATGCDGPLASAIICDGFESEPGPWTGRAERLGTVTRTTSRAEVGAWSLGPAITSAGGEAALRYDALGGFFSGDLWVRVSVYIPSAAAVRDFTFLSIGETSSPYQGISLGLGSDGHAGSYSTISADYVWHPMVVPRDRWVCFELHVALDDAAGAIEVYMDGALGASRAGLDTVPAAGISYANTGIDYASAEQGPLAIFLDEYAISTARLACP